MNRNFIWIGVVVIVAAGIGALVMFMNSPAPKQENSGFENTAAAPTAAPSQNENPPSDYATATPPSEMNRPASQKEFTVNGQNFSFEPSTITVKKGDEVKITLTSGDMMHDLKIDELGVATKILRAGEEDSVEFIADKIGTFEYYCSVGNHRAMGMKGILTVTE
ncbi:MAG: plastocyanin/azurin family copper-binding protein [Patescibacteria group bacterium]